MVAFATFETAIGTCGIAWTDAGIRGFQLPEGSPEGTEVRLRTRVGPRSRRALPPAAIARVITRVQGHLDGRSEDFRDVPLDLEVVTPFVMGVYRALQAVPAGTTTTYGELARMVGSPRAARAIGRAMAMNPVPILIPCQRVLAAGDRPGGFSAHGGLATKKQILAIEGAVAYSQSSLFLAG